MKFKVLILSVVSFCMIGVATAFADDLYNDYKAKEVKVTVNNSDIATPGLIISSDDKTLDSKTMVPLRDIANALQALVLWDPSTETVRIYKPNVHMMLFTAKDKKPFGIVNQGKSDFQIFSQIDNLQTKITSFKMTLTDPDGNLVKMTTSDGDTVTSLTEKVSDAKDNFWYFSKPLTVNFDTTGNYILNFYMKSSENSDYSLVSEKDIQCISQ